jgi:hypothetical protein
MGTIYSSAHTVIVWLGLRGPNTDQAMRSITALRKRVSKIGNDFIRTSRLQSYGLPDRHDPAWQGIGDLYTRKWFRRLWVVQEFALAKRVAMLCGLLYADGQEFSLLAEALNASRLCYVANKDRGYFGNDVDGFDALMFLKTVRDSVRGVISFHLLSVLNHACQYKTSEAVDKVYAILGLMNSRLRKTIKVDYSPQSRRQFWKLYIDVGHLVFSELPDLSLLVTVSSKDQHAEIPSWCPNYNRRLETYIFRQHHYQAGGSTIELQDFPHIASSLDRKRITLRGLVVDQVTDVLQSSWQFYRNKQEIGVQKAYIKAREWIENCQLLRKGEPRRIQAMDESLMRCLTAGITKDPTWHVPDKEELERNFALLMTLLHLEEHNETTVDEHLSKTQLAQVQALLTAIESACSGRKFFSTSNGLTGVGDGLIQPGDKICVFWACKMPLVLRKEPS